MTQFLDYYLEQCERAYEEEARCTGQWKGFSKWCFYPNFCKAHHCGPMACRCEGYDVEKDG